MSLTKDDLQAIGELLKPINQHLDKLEQGQVKLEQGQVKLEQGQTRLKKELDAVKKDIKAIKKDVSQLKTEVKYAFIDIGASDVRTEKRVQKRCPCSPARSSLVHLYRVPRETPQSAAAVSPLISFLRQRHQML